MKSSIQKLPDNIKQEIEIYLGQNEKILKSLCAIGEDNDKAGKVWLILTNESIFFHTEEKNKEPVVALLARNNIKLIEYFQKSTEIVVTFIPASSSKSTTKISFPIQRKELLEDFCEDLADLIDFKKETGSGVKIYSRQPKPKQTINSKPSPASASGSGSTTVSPPPPKPKPEIKTKAKPSDISLNNDIRLAKPLVKTNNQANETTEDDEFPPAKYIFMATVISVLVAFIWYQFFKLISGSRR